VLKEFAGDRFEDLELIMGFSGPRLTDFDRDAERVRHRIGELEQLGVNWVFVGPAWSPAPGPQEWVEAFGASFLKG
jgi:hypothetical protein